VHAASGRRRGGGGARRAGGGEKDHGKELRKEKVTNQYAKVWLMGTRAGRIAVSEKKNQLLAETSLTSNFYGSAPPPTYLNPDIRVQREG
jgi:hypothetical protein